MSQNLGSLPTLVTKCHISSTPSTPLNVWRNLWMPALGTLACSFLPLNIFPSRQWSSYISLQVGNLKLVWVVCCHQFLVHVPSNLFYIALICRWYWKYRTVLLCRYFFFSSKVYILPLALKISFEQFQFSSFLIGLGTSSHCRTSEQGLPSPYKI